MTSQQRIIRGIATCVAGVLAVLAGTYIRQVMIDGGSYVLPTTELVIAAVVGLVIGYLAPTPEEAKRNRENLFK